MKVEHTPEYREGFRAGSRLGARRPSRFAIERLPANYLKGYYAGLKLAEEQADDAFQAQVSYERHD